jgi:YD repeat-containing protein
MGIAQAEDVWFSLDVTDFPAPDDAVHYPTADAACRAGYAEDVVTWNTSTSSVLPYVPLTYDRQGQKPFYYTCITQLLIGDSAYQLPHSVALNGTQCPDRLVLDIVAGRCETRGEYDARRQMGDPNDEPNNDPDDCAGNPINPAIGNKFELETDFVDQDGELAFRRFFNGLDGLGRHSYETYLSVGDSSATLTFEDGRASLFSIAGGVATGEPAERGLLAKSGRNWVYSSPNNETLTFNAQGQLMSIRDAAGLTKSLTYGYDSSFNTQATVKDSRGHTLIYSEDQNGNLVEMTSGSLSVAYTFSPTQRLMKATRTVGAKVTSRSYLYEDASHPGLLTGLIDERGVRFATWSYDAQGRAVSSEHSGGADRTVVGYVDDSTTTVTNALGHTVKYQYAVLAGTRRMTAVTGEPVLGCPISNSSFTYDGRGQIATQTDALGHVTAFTYDPQGRITAKTEAKGTPQERTTTTTWDGTSFRPKTVTTADRVMTYTYDAQGRLTATTVSAVRN